MKLTIPTIAALLIAGCTPPEPLCTRDTMLTKDGQVIYGEPCVTPPMRWAVVPAEHDSDRDTPSRPDAPVAKPDKPTRGNPGNDKAVGNAGENPNGKGNMAERGNAGNRGASN